MDDELGRAVAAFKEGRQYSQKGAWIVTGHLPTEILRLRLHRTALLARRAELTDFIVWADRAFYTHVNRALQRLEVPLRFDYSTREAGLRVFTPWGDEPIRSGWYNVPQLLLPRL